MKINKERISFLSCGAVNNSTLAKIGIPRNAPKIAKAEINQAETSGSVKFSSKYENNRQTGYRVSLGRTRESIQFQWRMFQTPKEMCRLRQVDYQ